MKKTITCLSLLFLSFNAALHAQTPAWVWAKKAGGSGNEAVNGMYTDASGNSYVTGAYTSSSVTFGTNTFSNAGGLDFYVAKYDASGNVLWAKNGGGASNDVGYNVTADASGNVYVVGTSNSASVNFGSGSVTLHGYDDIFVLKYDASGNLQWAKGFGGGGNDIGQAIGIDANGNVYVTGYFASSSVVFGTTTLSNSGGNDYYIAKLDGSGNVLWAQKAGGSANESGSGIYTDSNGNSYVTGSYGSSSITFGSTTFTLTGGLDYFIVKYDASGNVLWAKSASGASNEVGYQVKADASGNAYVVGTFNSSSINFGSATVTLHAYDDIFLVKYDASGNLLWAKEYGGSANDIGASIAIDGGGNSYITGYFASTSIVFGTTTLTNAGGNDVYVAKLDGSGNIVWAVGQGGTASDACNGIGVDAGGSVYVGGAFGSTSIAFGSNTLTNSGGNDAFLARYDNTTGIAQESGSAATIAVVPNPNNGVFILQTSGFESLGKIHISVTDVLGREVHGFVLDTQASVQTDLSNLPGGTYYISFNQDGKQYRTRVLIGK